MNDDLLIEVISHNLIDKNIELSTASQYQLNIIDNQAYPLLETIRELINECDEFYISVAFLMTSGIKGIKMELNNANQKNIPAKIIVGNMNNFSDPKAIKELNQFNNIDIRLNMEGNLHTKGYFFRKNNIWTIIIGSSNLTQATLKTNKEWNMIINSTENGKLVENTIKSFTNLWEKSEKLNNVFKTYENTYKQEQAIRKKLNEYKNLKVIENIEPNLMQINALLKIEKSRPQFNKALIISATGTGKTYLAALDVRKIKPKRLLFVVHRENIARKSLKSFAKVLGKNISMGIFSGSERNNSDYIFSTIQTISKDHILKKFNKDYFDYIIIDEVHRAGANSYQKLIKYFTPKFLLGLTATPERNDDFNIYEMFDYNVPYEIRLNEAIENNLIVPFHYYGVSEVQVNNQVVDEDTIIDPKQRALNIKEKSEFYGYDGEKVHGLIFVDSINNSKALSLALNEIGYKTISLTGEDKEETRASAIQLVQEKDTSKPYLDFIISVDVFNEGVDIPLINQVLLLRPTKSTIIYIQQLGRGLRKAFNKDYLVILDFIGNYKRNFLIPIALSGDSTFDIDFLNRFVTNGNSYMPGSCTINFEDIPRKLILEKIDKSNFKNKKLIEHDYLILKQRLNRIPLLSDFYDHKLISPEFIMSYKKTYPEVLEVIDNTYKINFSNKEIEFLKLLYQEYNMAKRIHEIIIIKELLKNNKTLNEINEIIEKILNIPNQIDNTKNAFKHLDKKIFIKDNTRKLYDPLVINGQLNPFFKDKYIINYEYRVLVDDFIKYNLNYNKDNYKQINESALILYKNYKRKECFHLMNLDYHAGNQVGGYIADKNKNQVLIFMKADKSSYSNIIVNEHEIIWYSKNNRSLNKSALETNIAENKMIIEVFLKKESGEKEYYLGKAKVIDYEQTTINNKPIIKYLLKLETPIEKSLFQYFNY